MSDLVTALREDARDFYGIAKTGELCESELYVLSEDLKWQAADEIERLRAAIEEKRNLGCAAPEVVAQSFFARECQETFSAFLPENRNAGMIMSTIARLTELIRRARIDGANGANRERMDAGTSQR
mgnify:CR=1 FL=1